MSAGKKSKADELAQRLGAIAEHSAERASVNASPHASTGDAPRAKPVRVSVDLAPLQYLWLKGWCQQVAEDIGPTVKGVDVIRALLDELRDDPQLDQRIRAAIKARRI